MHIAVCDDDINEMMSITKLLDVYKATYNQDITYDIFDNPKTLLSSLSSGVYHLVLLDIVMPEMSGIDVASKIRVFNNDIPIAFLTTSPEFAVESYRIQAKDYLLKPVDSNLLFEVLSSIEKPKDDFILIKTNDAVKQLSVDDIVYIEVVSRKVWIYLKNGDTVVSPGTLSQLESKLLIHRQFYKPHRCYLVNFDLVAKINKEGIHTTTGTIIPVPRPNFVKTKNDYMNYFMS